MRESLAANLAKFFGAILLFVAVFMGATSQGRSGGTAFLGALLCFVLAVLYEISDGTNHMTLMLRQSDRK